MASPSSAEAGGDQPCHEKCGSILGRARRTGPETARRTAANRTRSRRVLKSNVRPRWSGPQTKAGPEEQPGAFCVQRRVDYGRWWSWVSKDDQHAGARQRLTALTTILKEKSAQRREANRAQGEARTHERVRGRPVEPDTRVMVTRRCHDRRMFLTPSGDPDNDHHTPESTANFYGYTIARAQLIYGFAFHGAVCLGNHHHLNATDRHRNRPYFKNSIHSNLARGFNARFARFDSFWSGGGSCDTVTPTDDDTLKDLAYTDVNPVTAGLVKWGNLWPGFTTYDWKFGETRTFVRPDWYYDKNNPDNPPTIELTRVRPDILPELSDDELFERLREECRRTETEFQAELKANNRRFVGLNKLAKTKWWKRAKTPEARFDTVPTFASSQAVLRIAELMRQKHWREDYCRARTKYIKGEPTEFPYGSFMLPKMYGAPVASSPLAPKPP